MRHVPLNRCRFTTCHIYVKSYMYVLIQPCGFTYMSHICGYMYIYVTYMWTNETYVTFFFLSLRADGILEILQSAWFRERAVFYNVAR